MLFAYLASCHFEATGSSSFASFCCGDRDDDDDDRRKRLDPSSPVPLSYLDSSHFEATGPSSFAPLCGGDRDDDDDDNDGRRTRLEPSENVTVLDSSVMVVGWPMLVLMESVLESIVQLLAFLSRSSSPFSLAKGSRSRGVGTS